MSDQDRTDEELVGLDEDAASVAAREMMIASRHATPGVITAYDATKQTVTVQPAIETKLFGRPSEPLPLCLDVPVQFPAGGDMIFTFPVAPGDECILIFSDRAIDKWLEAGGVQAPSEIRFHDLSDGMAIVGLSSKPRVLQPVASTDAAELRTRDGVTKIRILQGEVHIFSDAVKVDCSTALVNADSVKVSATTVEVDATTVMLGGGGLSPDQAGVVVGACLDPFSGLTHFALQGASTVVMAKKG